MIGKIKTFIESRQREIVLMAGYFLVFLLAFALGRISSFGVSAPDILLEEPADTSQSNNNPVVKGVQIQDTLSEAAQSQALRLEPDSEGNCSGMIKGNISSSSRIYHLPGGSFYNRTRAEACFTDEKSAQEAGFRKSKQ